MVKKIYIITPSFGMLTILFFILGFFAYSSWEGGMAMVLLYWATSIVAILGLFPILGPVATILINLQYTIPGILAFAGLEASWVTALIYAYSIAISTVLTLFTTWMLLKE